MPEALPFQIRKECPPGACECRRDELLEQWDKAPDDTDIRILRLTREQEKVLIARIESIASYEELGRIEQRMQEQLGIRLTITPSANGVRTVMGLQIRLAEQPGLCRRTREQVPAAVRRCLNKHPDIVYALLNARDLLGAG
ncbi:hypothetical protein D0T25_21250 [Duganella sp. BJB488]|uniref:hypothetical protein n=1 Tax=unclassified Duganella TaxID=2636909 RepID=UPI000E346150|nr:MULTISPECIES: hypothetical protein [unclassified Duganella]NVD69671.1 hypothetical protein [Duganella sp. BJB1802]RFP10390.1 hypothetical protein D0T26_28020 [Duganella sp. BJB489]RFP18227.1 hypothetical protein D0T25_21250 [Duganella sp. BJB488]RFP38019.1 hypothetical protein D0T24_07720 [Duganella sp. BJB480]